MVESTGKIIIEPGLNVWPHELKTAEALAAAGYTVEFIRRRRLMSKSAVIFGKLRHPHPERQT